MSNFGYQIFDLSGGLIHDPSDTEIRVLGTSFFDFSGSSLPLYQYINTAVFGGEANWVGVTGTIHRKRQSFQGDYYWLSAVGGDALYQFSHMNGSTAVLVRNKSINSLNSYALDSNGRLYVNSYYSRTTYMVGRKI